MKIKITKQIPVQSMLAPKVGEVYEVIEQQKGRSYVGTPNIIIVHGQKVGVWNDECIILEDNDG